MQNGNACFDKNIPKSNELIGYYRDLIGTIKAEKTNPEADPSVVDHYYSQLNFLFQTMSDLEKRQIQNQAR